jgi:hypothetical protein
VRTTGQFCDENPPKVIDPAPVALVAALGRSSGEAKPVADAVETAIARMAGTSTATPASLLAGMTNLLSGPAVDAGP